MMVSPVSNSGAQAHSQNESAGLMAGDQPPMAQGSAALRFVSTSLSSPAPARPPDRKSVV